MNPVACVKVHHCIRTVNNLPWKSTLVSALIRKFCKVLEYTSEDLLAVEENCLIDLIMTILRKHLDAQTTCESWNDLQEREIDQGGSNWPGADHVSWYDIFTLNLQISNVSFDRLDSTDHFLLDSLDLK